MRVFEYLFGVIVVFFLIRVEVDEQEPPQNPPENEDDQRQEEDVDQNGEANQHEGEEDENEVVEIDEPVLDAMGGFDNDELDDQIVDPELVPEQEPVPNELDNDHEQNDDAEVAEIEPVNNQQDAIPQEPVGHRTEAVHRERIHLRPFQGLRRGTRLQIGDQYLRIRGEQEGSYEHPARNVFEENLFQL